MKDGVLGKDRKSAFVLLSFVVVVVMLLLCCYYVVIMLLLCCYYVVMLFCYVVVVTDDPSERWIKMINIEVRFYAHESGYKIKKHLFISR